jgi:predicted DNA-binding transcriptional regulator YafY
MPDQAVAQATRLIELIAWLSQRDSDGPVSYPRAAARLGVTADTIRRDLDVLFRLTDELRPWLASLSVGLQADGFTIQSLGHYRRPFRLSPDEVLAVAIGLAGVPRGAPIAERLLRTLVPEHRPVDVERRYVLGPAASPHVEQVLALVRRARDDNRKLDVVYCASHGDPGRRTIEAHQVLTAGGAWYVHAWCETSGGWRLFRAERFLEITPLEECFEPRPVDPAEDRAAQLFRADATVAARVVFTPRVSRWLRERYPDGRDLPDGSYEVAFAVADPSWFVREILQYGAEAEVVEPESLREAVRDMVADSRQPSAISKLNRKPRALTADS